MEISEKTAQQFAEIFVGIALMKILEEEDRI